MYLRFNLTSSVDRKGKLAQWIAQVVVRTPGMGLFCWLEVVCSFDNGLSYWITMSSICTGGNVPVFSLFMVPCLLVARLCMVLAYL